MPRYEFSEGSSNKFWEITLQDKNVITHYGRIGAEGQSTTKSFKSAAEAKSAYDKLIAEKTKKGYALKGGGGSSTPPEKPAKSGATDANPLITRLDAWLKKVRPKYYATLNPGAAAGEIEKLEKQTGALPQTLKDLLRWRNGQTSSSRLIDNWGLMSVKNITAAWTTLNDLKKSGDIEKDAWDAAWIPFLENGGGDHLCIDLKKKDAVREFWHADEDRDVAYPSIDKMLGEFLNWAEKGNWGIEDTGFVAWGKEIKPSDDPEEADEDDDEDEDEKEKEKEPSAPMGKPAVGVKEKRLLQLPEKEGYRSFSPDISLDGKHLVYNISEKKRERFVLDGKESPWFELLCGPWFDEATGIMVYSEGKPRHFRWHIGDAPPHDYYDQTHNPVFSPDGKHHCYSAKKNNKWFLVVDGVPQKETYDRVGMDPVWSPDGTKIAFVAKAGDKEFVVNNGERGPNCEAPGDLVFSPDGSKVAYCVTKDARAWEYQIWCGAYKSDVLGLAAKPEFTTSGVLWFSYSERGVSGGYGICIGGKKIKTERSVDTAFVLDNGQLAGHLESDGHISYLIRPGKPEEVLPEYNSALFHPPGTIVIFADRRTQVESMSRFSGREVVCVNGKETEGYDDIIKPHLSPDGKTIIFGARRGRDVLWVEMPV